MRRYFTNGPTAKYGHDQRMLGLMLWPLIRDRCLVHDKHYRLAGVNTVPLSDPGSHFGAGLACSLSFPLLFVRDSAGGLLFRLLLLGLLGIERFL